MAYCVREILVPLAFEYDTTNYPTKDEDIIDHVPIITSVATGTDTEKTKDGPFHKYFDDDMNFLWDMLHHVFGKTKVWMHTKPSTKSKNGQYALFLLNTLFLDLQYVIKITDQLYPNLGSFFYDG